MPSIDFSCYCASCGAGICINVTVKESAMGITLDISPCENCLERARDEGFDEGVESVET